MLSVPPAISSRAAALTTHEKRLTRQQSGHSAAKVVASQNLAPGSSFHNNKAASTIQAVRDATCRSTHSALFISETTTASLVPVTFSVTLPLKFGEHLAIVGSAEALGSWDPARSIDAEWTPGCVWKVATELPADDPVEFKLLVKQGTRVVAWQPGDNQTLGDAIASCRPSDVVLVEAAWGSGVTPVITVESATKLAEEVTVATVASTADAEQEQEALPCIGQVAAKNPSTLSGLQQGTESATGNEGPDGVTVMRLDAGDTAALFAALEDDSGYLSGVAAGYLSEHEETLVADEVRVQAEAQDLPAISGSISPPADAPSSATSSLSATAGPSAAPTSPASAPKDSNGAATGLPLAPTTPAPATAAAPAAAAAAAMSPASPSPPAAATAEADVQALLSAAEQVVQRAREAAAAAAAMSAEAQQSVAAIQKEAVLSSADAAVAVGKTQEGSASATSAAAGIVAEVTEERRPAGPAAADTAAAAVADVGLGEKRPARPASPGRARKAEVRPFGQPARAARKEELASVKMSKLLQSGNQVATSTAVPIGAVAVLGPEVESNAGEKTGSVVQDEVEGKVAHLRPLALSVKLGEDREDQEEKEQEEEEPVGVEGVTAVWNVVAVQAEEGSPAAEAGEEQRWGEGVQEKEENSLVHALSEQEPAGDAASLAASASGAMVSQNPSTLSAIATRLPFVILSPPASTTVHSVEPHADRLAASLASFVRQQPLLLSLVTALASVRWLAPLWQGLALAWRRAKQRLTVPHLVGACALPLPLAVALGSVPLFFAVNAVLLAAVVAT